MCSKSAIGHGVITFLCSIQFIGYSGCASSLSTGTYDPDHPLGLFVNSDLSSSNLGAIRLPGGESVYVFGSYFASGLIQEITGAVLQDADGNEATATLENGLVKRATSFDGSTLDMSYDEVSSRRIKGRADVFFAGLDESDQNQTMEFDIDLQKVAADLADEVRDLLGLNISDSEPPEDPLGKTKVFDSALEFEKTEARAQLILAFAQFHIAAYAALGFVIVEIMSAVVGILFELVANVVLAVTQAVIIAMFTPFILLGEVMRLAVRQPLFVVDINIDLNVSPPKRPR
ncbi:MAG: hypothetical protein IPK83_11145 [Planctomycetes bacterium]|nr:hypothetical protein [Planctomycetota bacterium]